MKNDVEILISAMHQVNDEIIAKSNIRTNALLINQCDINDIWQKSCDDYTYRTICTTDRGLSRSRNLAIENTVGKYCMICDDDERFYDDMPEKIASAYEKYPQADVIVFNILYPVTTKRSFGTQAKRLGKFECLRVSSVQISFKVSSVKGKVKFDTNLGAGTQNGSGEENKFLLDCIKAGLKIYYVPVEVGVLSDSDSTWFSGYNERFFFNRGKTTRYTLGLPLASLYAVYFLVFKYKLYKKDCSFLSAVKHLSKGLFAGDINAQP